MELRGDGSVYRQKGSRFWWIQFFVDGERRRESTKTENEKLAWRILRNKLVAIENGELAAGSADKLEKLYEALERDYTINGRKDIVNLKSRWTNHLSPAFGELLVSEVSAEVVAKYIAARQAAKPPASNATINRELAILKRAFKLAVRNGRLKVGQQPFIEMLKERNIRKGFLKDSEYEALARETAKIGLWLRAMFEVACVYGWRKSELLEMRVSQIDLDNREILLNPGETKNDQGRTAPMTDLVLVLLTRAIAGKKPDDYVFTREKDAQGRKPKKPYIFDFRDDWDKATAAAGCVGLIFHDLRRTGVRNMRRLGISEKVAMTISGHRTRSVFERYNIVDPADLKDAGRKLNQASKPSPSPRRRADDQVPPANQAEKRIERPN